MKDKSLNWKVTCDRYVAFFDIMGFKDYIFRNSHEIVTERMQKLSSLVEEIRDYYNVDNLIDSSDSSSSVDFSFIEIYPVMFSDSIIFISNNDSFDAALSILYQSAWFLSGAISSGIPIKGAIAHGPFTAIKSKSIFFGQPLVDAYELQEDLELYGVILHNTMEKQMFKKNIYFSFIEDRFMIKHETPLKSGKINHYNINWPKFNKEKDKAIIKSVVENFYFETTGRPRRYIDNTLNFIEKS